MNTFNIELNKKFAGLDAYVKRTTEYSDDSYHYELTITVPVCSKKWNKHKRKKRDPIDAMHLVVDLSNFLYRSASIQARCPSIGGIKKRASKGIKTLTFTYILSRLQLGSIATNDNHFYFCKTIKLKPIDVKPSLSIVN